MADRPTPALRRSERLEGAPAVPPSPTESALSTPTVTITQEMTEGKLKLMQSSPLARLLGPAKQSQTAPQISTRNASRITTNRKAKRAPDEKSSPKPAPAVSAGPNGGGRTLERIRKRTLPSSKASSEAEKPPRGPDVRDELSAVLYLGHIPHGFYEREMHSYFSQFGTIVHLRLSRARKTGASRGFAFIEFEGAAVAVAAAEAMNGYLMHGRALKTEVLPKKRVHPKMFDGANRPFTKVDWLEKARLAVAREPQDCGKIAKRLKKVQKRRRVKQAKLDRLGIDYKVPEIFQLGTVREAK